MPDTIFWSHGHGCVLRTPIESRGERHVLKSPPRRCRGYCERRGVRRDTTKSLSGEVYGIYILHKRMGGKPGKERVAAASVPEVSGVDIGEAKGDNFGWIHNAAPRPKEVGTLETIKEWWKGGGGRGQFVILGGKVCHIPLRSGR